ncbi:DUF4862 family protein [Arcanobacterium phocisimile]|uniref:DUF4862 family protein n=1 Tax=Arcanobacterium phocisimile TaxID=1302235 RepID=A0ABX7IGA5_9ACTO|nr:DUF4862 family protein [Arcanobacterium phocisimile]QRV02158.1 DUF4862 family protein [Arcanobacterium phocisimile]
MSVPFIIGAYTSLPATKQEQAEYYQILAAQPWVNGLEIPFRDSITDDVEWFVSQLSENFTTNMLTPIPGVMHRVGKDPLFGLASPDESGQTAALDYLLNASWAIKAINDAANRQVFTHIALHSAPTAIADPVVFNNSLDVVTQWDWDGAKLVIEHQDKFIEGQVPQKGFLSLEDEIAAARAHGIGIVINWGRSAIEGRNATTPCEHVEIAAHAQALAGVMFSGAHAEPNAFGPAWNDDHVPLDTNEPTSLMTSAHVADVARTAGKQQISLMGAKVSIGTNASLSTRLDILRHIAMAAGSTTGLQIG